MLKFKILYSKVSSQMELGYKKLELLHSSDVAYMLDGENHITSLHFIADVTEWNVMMVNLKRLKIV